jgi:hypothetical protein
LPKLSPAPCKPRSDAVCVDIPCAHKSTKAPGSAWLRAKPNARSAGRGRARMLQCATKRGYRGRCGAVEKHPWNLGTRADTG